MTEPTPGELSSLRDEVLRLARMVDDLQTLAAADAASLHLQRRRCDLAGIAAEAVGSLARRFEAAGIALRRELSSAPVLGDPRWLHQAVTNLLGNAVKFTPAGGTVTIVTRPDGADAVLEVADTGIGIPAAELPHIFDRFWRGQNAAQTSGSGLGLAIAAELARAHGGTLTASSTPGEGTRLTLTLPRAGNPRPFGNQRFLAERPAVAWHADRADPAPWSLFCVVPGCPAPAASRSCRRSGELPGPYGGSACSERSYRLAWTAVADGSGHAIRSGRDAGGPLPVVCRQRLPGAIACTDEPSQGAPGRLGEHAHRQRQPPG